ncbi:nuclear transport factor 2 family protein [Streptomyces sp. NPDC005573]|uniref:nuclear transport factor 2 family protein n=1 Tax=unclassified Streptomyces TaxID=2593676 RepID=UPI0033B89871
MGTASGSGFDVDTLRRGIEGDTGNILLSLYADDAEIRIIDQNDRPSHPKIIRGRGEIAEMLDEVYSRDMTHHLEQCVIEGTHAAFTESCQYADGTKVIAESMVTLRDGRIGEQIMIQAWDEG